MTTSSSAIAAFERSDEVVREGVTAPAGTVTSAAMVMVAVFSIFATLSILDMKEMGIGLAVAVLIDATIVRAICCRRR